MLLILEKGGESTSKSKHVSQSKSSTNSQLHPNYQQKHQGYIDSKLSHSQIDSTKIHDHIDQHDIYSQFDTTFIHK